MKKYKYFIIIIIIGVLFFKLSNKKEDNVIYVNYYEKMINRIKEKLKLGKDGLSLWWVLSADFNH